jgi:type IV pilus assembly protein PilM
MSKKGKIISYETINSQRDEKLRKGIRSLIGIDIGSSTVKIVQLKKNKIVRTGIENIPEGMINQGRIESSSQLAELIRHTLTKNKIKGNLCSLCISGNEIIIRELNLPAMTEEQIMDNIKHEITSFLPLNHDEYSIDYKVLEYFPSQDGTPGKMRIMVAAVPNEFVNSYLNALKKANLKIAYVDVVPNIVSKLIKYKTLYSNTGSNSDVGVIDFGARTTSIIILNNGNYFIHKTISNGGDYLTAQIAEKLNVDFIEAEVFKKKSNFFENNFRNNECLFIKNIIDYLITDIDRTLEFYKNRNNQMGVDRIYLMGGGSLLKGLPGYMKEHFGVDVTFLTDELQQLQKSGNIADGTAVFTQAFGATLRED